MARRYFTLEEAQELIPRLVEILSRSVQLQQLLRLRTGALGSAGYEVSEALLSGEEEQPASEGSHALLEEARGIYSAIVEDARRIEALGGEFRGPDLVDFWSWEEGQREVLLCWRLGEQEIVWCHSPEAGIAGRRPVGGLRFTREQETSSRS